MARPRAFDTDLALAGAMDVFWEHGYEGASLPQILSGMQITRGSLYKAFTDKKTLFLTVMERYEEAAVTPACALLTDTSVTDGHQRIADVFQGILDAVAQDDHRGCLLCSAAAGPASEDLDIGRVVNTLLGRMRDGFLAALHATPQANSLNRAQLDARAEMLLTHYVGLRILTRAGTSQAQLSQSIDALSQMLRA